MVSLSLKNLSSGFAILLKLIGNPAFYEYMKYASEKAYMDKYGQN
jgi:hypothetical protein